MEVLRPLKAMRKHCLECSGDSFKAVEFCSIVACTLWPYRMGKRPQNVRDQRLVTAACMPSADIPLEDLSDADLKPLPASVVQRKPSGRTMTDEEKRKLREQFDRGRRKPR